MAEIDLSSKSVISSQVSLPTLGAYRSSLAGKSILNLKHLIGVCARYDYNLLFVGERGTGKEGFANTYIQESRRKGNFERINCASFDDNHIRSELFGYVKGAFTGADKDKDGLFKKINNGGIFLDELGDASPNFHATILRVLQSGDYLPLGSTKTQKIENVKIIAATSKPEALREDLLDRFKIVYIPSLAKRQDDIPEILRQIWHSIERKNNPLFPEYISQNALLGLKRHNWPGNVRELINALDIAILLSLEESSNTLRANAFPTVPNLLNSPDTDDSEGLKILELTGNSQPIPIKEFLIPPQGGEAKTSQKTGKDSQSDLSFSLEKIFQTITPAQYHAQFWEYYASNGANAPYLVPRFIGELAESSIRRSLNEAKERINKRDDGQK